MSNSSSTLGKKQDPGKPEQKADAKSEQNESKELKSTDALIDKAKERIAKAKEQKDLSKESRELLEAHDSYLHMDDTNKAWYRRALYRTVTGKAKEDEHGFYLKPPIEAFIKEFQVLLSHPLTEESLEQQIEQKESLDKLLNSADDFFWRIKPSADDSELKDTSPRYINPELFIEILKELTESFNRINQKILKEPQSVNNAIREAAGLFSKLLFTLSIHMQLAEAAKKELSSLLNELKSQKGLDLNTLAECQRFLKAYVPENFAGYFDFLENLGSLIKSLPVIKGSEGTRGKISDLCKKIATNIGKSAQKDFEFYLTQDLSQNIPKLKSMQERKIALTETPIKYVKDSLMALGASAERISDPFVLYKYYEHYNKFKNDSTGKQRRLFAAMFVVGTADLNSRESENCQKYLNLMKKSDDLNSKLLAPKLLELALKAKKENRNPIAIIKDAIQKDPILRDRWEAAIAKKHPEFNKFVSRFRDLSFASATKSVAASSQAAKETKESKEAKDAKDVKSPQPAQQQQQSSSADSKRSPQSHQQPSASASGLQQFGVTSTRASQPQSGSSNVAASSTQEHKRPRKDS